MSHADDLLELAARLRRLTPCWNNPERFHEAKSELVADLRRLAADAPKPEVKRVIVPVQVERVVEKIVYVPTPKPARRKAEAQSTPDLFQKVTE
ncbi:MAG: hypothetical protein ACLGJC_20485 [Alphaproteobacteria bacterium]